MDDKSNIPTTSTTSTAPDSSPSTTITLTEDTISAYIKRRGINMTEKALDELLHDLQALSPGKDKLAYINKVLEIGGYIPDSAKVAFSQGVSAGLQISSEVASKMLSTMAGMAGLDISTVQIEKDVTLSRAESTTTDVDVDDGDDGDEREDTLCKIDYGEL